MGEIDEAALEGICGAAGQELGRGLAKLFRADPVQAAKHVKAAAMTHINIDGWCIHFKATAHDEDHCWMCREKEPDDGRK